MGHESVEASGLSVVVPRGCEDIEDFGIFKRRGLMHEVSGNDEAVAFAHVEEIVDACSRVFNLEEDLSVDDVKKLLVRVLMARADPSLHLQVADQHETVRRGHDLATEAGLGRGHVDVVGLREERFYFGVHAASYSCSIVKLVCLRSS